MREAQQLPLRPTALQRHRLVAHVVLQRQPQVMIAGTGHGSGQDTPLQWARSEPRLKDTEARQQGRVFDIDANTVSRGSPRIVDGLEDMLRLIHPELSAKLEK